MSGAPPAAWACPACTFLNSTLLNACELCEAARPGGGPAPPHATRFHELVGRDMTDAEAGRLADAARAAVLDAGDLGMRWCEYMEITTKPPGESWEALAATEWDLRQAKVAYYDSQLSPLVSDVNLVAVECSICFCDAAPGEAVRLSCGHMFCKECVAHHIAAKMDEGDVEIRCLAHGCSGVLTHREVAAAASAEVLQVLAKRGLDRAAAIDPSLYSCPTPDCKYVVAFEGSAAFHCPLCSVERCVACGASPYHTGKTCEEHKTTLRTSEEEEATQRYLAQSAFRICKRCGVAVQKAKGCDKMKCRCGFKFCFKCGVENAACNCTGSNHGFWDNITQQGDFSR